LVLQIRLISVIYTGPPELETNGKITTAFDMWAFGAVLLSVASWVVLGPQGVRDFTDLRCSAIKKLRQNQKDDPLQTVPIADDAFHDGKQMLEKEIVGWMNKLIRNALAYDNVTVHVITMVKEQLLVDDVEKRAKPLEICELWSGIRDKAEKDLKSWVEKNQFPTDDQSLDQRSAGTSLGQALSIFTTESETPAKKWQTNNDAALILETNNQIPGRSEQPPAAQLKTARTISSVGETSVTADTATDLTRNSTYSNVGFGSSDENRRDTQVHPALQHSIEEGGKTYHLPIDKAATVGKADAAVTRVRDISPPRFKGIDSIPYDIFSSTCKLNEQKENNPWYNTWLPFWNLWRGRPQKDPELARIGALHSRHFVSYM
jgi:hypothetical protein